jgi:putative nucleotidyltransferase with HDIG domain
MSTLTLDEIVSRTTDIPSIPEAALAVVRMSNDQNVTAHNIADRIAHDQSLAARVLRLSNSAYYGLPRQITTIQDAVILLGMKTVRHLALVASTFPWLARARKGYELGPQALWSHSIAVSIGAQLIAGKVKGISTDEAFTAGLLHDLGKVVLSMWLEDKLSELVMRSEVEQASFDKLEREVLGFDHGEVGAYLAERWNLPEPLHHAIRHHHRPDELEPNELLTDAVHVADILAMSLGFGIGGDGLRYGLCLGAMERLGVSGEEYDLISSEMLPAVTNALNVYGAS